MAAAAKTTVAQQSKGKQEKKTKQKQKQKEKQRVQLPAPLEDSEDAASVSSAKSRPSYKHIPHSQKPPHLVAKRNARERRRVQAVNQAFYRLRRSVPIENRNKRVSKVKTLQRAIDYIRDLERTLAEADSSSPGPHGQSSSSSACVARPTSVQDKAPQVGARNEAESAPPRRPRVRKTVTQAPPVASVAPQPWPQATTQCVAGTQHAHPQHPQLPQPPQHSQLQHLHPAYGEQAYADPPTTAYPSHYYASAHAAPVDSTGYFASGQSYAAQTHSEAYPAAYYAASHAPHHQFATDQQHYLAQPHSAEPAAGWQSPATGGGAPSGSGPRSSAAELSLTSSGASPSSSLVADSSGSCSLSSTSSGGGGNEPAAPDSSTASPPVLAGLEPRVGPRVDRCKSRPAQVVCSARGAQVVDGIDEPRPRASFSHVAPMPPPQQQSNRKQQVNNYTSEPYRAPVQTSARAAASSGLDQLSGERQRAAPRQLVGGYMADHLHQNQHESQAQPHFYYPQHYESARANELQAQSLDSAMAMQHLNSCEQFAAVPAAHEYAAGLR